MKRKIKVLCSQCDKETHHEIVADYSMRNWRIAPPDSFMMYIWRAQYQIVMCCGCGNVSFRQEKQIEGECDPKTGDQLTTVELFPPRIEGRTRKVSDYDFPLNITRIYHETLSAIANSMNLLAAMGMRAIVEAICNDKSAKGGNLEIKIDALASAGVLTSGQASILHKHRFLGNIAAHEIVPATNDELVAAFDIIEAILRALYIVPILKDHIKTREPGHKPT